MDDEECGASKQLCNLVSFSSTQVAETLLRVSLLVWEESRRYGPRGCYNLVDDLRSSATYAAFAWRVEDGGQSIW